MKIFEISDDSGFMGIANYDTYKSFLNRDWDFNMIKEKIIDEMNLHHLLFWGTGTGNIWKVKIDSTLSNNNFYREERAVIEVTNGKLHLTNYEALTMAAQFEHVKLPQKHHEHLHIDLENGKYMVRFRQMENPETHQSESDYDFELMFTKIINMPDLYVNNLKTITWNVY